MSESSGGKRMSSSRFMKSIGGDQLSVGTLGHGNGSFQSSLSAFAPTLEQDQSTMSEILHGVRFFLFTRVLQFVCVHFFREGRGGGGRGSGVGAGWCVVI